MDSVMQYLRGAGSAFTDLVALGGPVVAILLVVSVFTLTIIIAKLWQFSYMHVRDRRTARSALNIYRGGNVEAAISTAHRSRNPASQVLARAIEYQSRGLPEATIREELLRFGSDLLESMRAYLRPLEVIASLAPLLGLLGTVLGMIEAFRQLQQAGSQVNPAILAGGIWEALLATAVGLAVAIAAIVVLNWFERIADRVAHDMDNIVTQVFTLDVIHPTSPKQDVPVPEQQQRRAPHL